MNFLHKDKKNNIICHSENKGEEVTAVIIGLLPYKALKRFFLSNEKNEMAEIFLFAVVFCFYGVIRLIFSIFLNYVMSHFKSIVATRNHHN